MSHSTDIVYRFVCAVASENMAHVRRFRTYKTRKNVHADCKIWEAVRATTATVRIFKEIKIAGTGGIKERFIDAGVKCNNPARIVVDEARELFGKDRRIVLISIGSGHPGIIGLTTPDAFQRILSTQLINTLKRIATDCEDVAVELEKQYEDLPDTYLRFSVTHGAGLVSLEEWKKIGSMVTHTKKYLEDVHVSKALDTAVQCICTFSSLPLSYFLESDFSSGDGPVESLTSPQVRRQTGIHRLPHRGAQSSATSSSSSHAELLSRLFPRLYDSVC